MQKILSSLILIFMLTLAPCLVSARGGWGGGGWHNNGWNGGWRSNSNWNNNSWNGRGWRNNSNWGYRYNRWNGGGWNNGGWNGVRSPNWSGVGVTISPGWGGPYPYSGSSYYNFGR